MMLRIICFLFVIVGSPIYAKDTDTDSVAAMAAYKIAIDKVLKGRGSIESGRSIVYTETIEEKHGDKQSSDIRIQFDVNGNEVRDYLDSGDTASSLNWDFSVLVNPSSFPRAARLVNESETAWIFEIPTQISASIETSEQAVDVSRVNDKIVDALTTTLVISKTNPRLLSQKIYAHSSFKPQSMVTVEEFNIRIDYSQAWHNGPWVAVSLSRQLSGTYAFFVDVEEFSLIRNEQFKLVDKS